jgi:hypothetical protein
MWVQHKGRIASKAAESYEKYCNNLEEEYRGQSSVSIIRLNTHMGFALSVKHGLEHVESEYCLILQHDRIFIEQQVKYIPLFDILNCFENYPSIRNQIYFSHHNLKYYTYTISQ